PKRVSRPNGFRSAIAASALCLVDCGGSPPQDSFIGRFALPYGEHRPALRLQGRAVALIALAVSIDLGSPVPGIGLDLARSVDAAGAAMPEAAVDEDAYLAACKNKVRLARKVSLVKAVAQPLPMQKPANSKLGSRVPAPDPSHD